MFHSHAGESLPMGMMGSSSDFGSWGGYASSKSHTDPFFENNNNGKQTTGIYKPMNYRVLEDQLRKRLQDAQNFLNKIELIPQDTEAAANLASALSDAEVQVQQLDIEARASPSGQALASEVASYSEQLWSLRQQNNTISSRSIKTETPGAHLGTRDLECANSRLIGECNATALQTEGLGLTIMEQLRYQRDTILKTNRLAEETGAEGIRGKQTIVKMIRNHWLNRAILTATIILLAVCILLVLAYKFRRFPTPI